MRQFWVPLVEAMTAWHQGKLFVEHAISIDHDALHVIVGVMLWIVLGLALRRSLSCVRPLLWLFVLILWNEAVDLWTEQWPDPGQQYGEGAKDLLLTMLVPTMLLLAIRLRPALFRSPFR